MANGEAGATQSVLNGMPWWVKAIAFVGFPIIAAVASMYVNFAMLQPHVLEMRNDHIVIQEAVDSMAYTNFVMCQRSATDVKDAEKCLKPPNWIKDKKRILQDLER